jgi:hypothetical protein
VKECKDYLWLKNELFRNPFFKANQDSLPEDVEEINMCQKQKTPKPATSEWFSCKISKAYHGAKICQKYKLSRNTKIKKTKVKILEKFK